jgi:GntR family transcriptional regulator, L-lactate dehydrogenase operon regulator
MPDLSDRIETLIATGRFAPGDRLPAERQLALDLGVSRSRLREAIKQLAIRGLVTSHHGGGTYVTSPEDAEPVRAALQSLAPLARSEAGYWRDVIEIRKSLEGDAAAYAARRADADDRSRMTAAYEALSAALLSDPAQRPGTALALAKLDAGFHMMIARAAHNPVLYQVMAGLEGLLEASISDSLAQLYRSPGVLTQLDGQHRRILEAVLAGHPDEARAAATEHLLFVEDQIEHLEQGAARHKRATQAFQHIATARHPQS